MGLVWIPPFMRGYVRNVTQKSSRSSALLVVVRELTGISVVGRFACPCPPLTRPPKAMDILGSACISLLSSPFSLGLFLFALVSSSPPYPFGVCLRQKCGCRCLALSFNGVLGCGKNAFPFPCPPLEQNHGITHGNTSSLLRLPLLLPSFIGTFFGLHGGLS
jgi:hypothetical protein